MQIKLAAAVLICIAGASLLQNRGVAGDLDNKSGVQSSPPAWILSAYAKKISARTGISVLSRDVQFEPVDLNDDGHADWIIFSSLDCGSAGCVGDVYAFIGGRYCYVGWTPYGDAPDSLRNQYKDLKCKKGEDGPPLPLPKYPKD